MKFSDVFPVSPGMGVGCSCNNGVGCVGCAMGVGCSGSVGCDSGSCSSKGGKQGGRGYGPSIDTQASFIAPTIESVREAGRVGGVGSGDLLVSVTAEEMVAFMAKVDTLMADVERVQDDAEKQGKAVPLFDQWTLLEWNPWYIGYKQWAAMHESGASRLAGSVGVEFGNWQSQFNVQLGKFKDLGGQSVLVPIDTSVPVDPPEPDEGPGFFERLLNRAEDQMLLTTLLAGGGLLAYYHVFMKPSAR